MGKVYLLFRRKELCGFCHKMHAAQQDSGLTASLRLLAQLKAVPHCVRYLQDLMPLVAVCHNCHIQFLFNLFNFLLNLLYHVVCPPFVF